MKIGDKNWQAVSVGSTLGAEAPNCTMMIAVANCATGTSVCITIQSWQ